MKITTRTPENVYVQVGLAESLEMPSFVTHNPQDASEQHDYSRLTVLLPVNGQDFSIVVEAQSPSSAADRRTVKARQQDSNKPATTDLTSQRSTIRKAMSTASATTATTAGTLPTTPTTTPTSTTRATNRKGRPVVNAERDEKIRADYATGKYTQVQLAVRYQISTSRLSKILRAVNN